MPQFENHWFSVNAFKLGGNFKYEPNALLVILAMQSSLQSRLPQYVNRELHMFKLDLENTEEPEIKLPTSVESLKKQESSRKTSPIVVFGNYKVFSEYEY